MDATHWNQRYAGDGFVYGSEPNAFLAEHADLIPTGPVLCIAEGEGRNAVFLASRGLEVTAVDQSKVGLAKARSLAESRGLHITTTLANLIDFEIEEASWNAVVSIWAHLPKPLRREVHGRCVRGLRPGGVFVLEAYTPAQLRYGTGGPRDIEALMALGDLREELTGLELVVAREIERHVQEGQGHSGLSAVVQVVGRKP